MAALESARGCLARCRGSGALAEAHLRRALEISAGMAGVEFFADLMETFAYATDRGEQLQWIVDAVRAVELSPAQALARIPP